MTGPTPGGGRRRQAPTPLAARERRRDPRSTHARLAVIARFRRDRPIRCRSCPRQRSFAQVRSSLRRSEAALRPVPDPGPPAPRLELAPYDLNAALALERDLGVEPRARPGARPPRAGGRSTRRERFWMPHESHDPSAFAGIERALALIARHIRAGTRIMVHGDYDVDGVCATAIMVRALRGLGADADWYLPDRLTDGYGLALATVRRLAASGTGLLAHRRLRDHRGRRGRGGAGRGPRRRRLRPSRARADGRLPDCEIVHPGVCGYPCADLCGTAVAYKLAQALGAPGRRGRARAGGARHRRGPDAARGREPPSRPGRACGPVAHREPGPARADGRRERGPERAQHRLARVSAGPADQRRRAARPCRRRPRAAADRRRAASRGDRIRA